MTKPDKGDGTDAQAAQLLAREATRALPNIALLVDRALVVVEASDFARQHFGDALKPGMSLLELFPTVSDFSLKQNFDAATKGNPQRIEILDVDSEKMRGLAGQIGLWPGTSLYLVSLMVTRELAGSHDELIQIIDNYVHGVVVHRGGMPLMVNQTMANLVDARDPAAVTAHPISRWLHPDDRQMVEENVRLRLQGKPAPDHYEFRLMPEGGGEKWVENRAAIISWQGQPAVLASLADITERRLAQESREKARILFRRVFEAQPNPATLTNLATGRYLDTNRAFQEVLGYERERCIGRTSAELDIWTNPADRARVVEDVQSGRSVRDRVMNFRHADGQIVTMALTVERIPFDEEDLLLMIARDVTDELRAARELRQSRDAAELANRTKSEFLANMSHELRTPLNAILGFSEILKTEALGPIGEKRYAEYAEDIFRSGRHLLEIINDILDLSKVEAGRLQLHEDRVDLAEVVSQCHRLVRERAQTAGIALRVELDRPEMIVWTDPRLMKQILLNLLSNSVKFTNRGGEITIALRSGEDALELEIADTGIGMTDQEIEVALTPFGQVDSTLARQFSGTGLGLPLVAAFCEKLGYTLAIVSEKNVGTRVTISIPVDRLTNDHAPVTVTSE